MYLMISLYPQSNGKKVKQNNSIKYDFVSCIAKGVNIHVMWSYRCLDVKLKISPGKVSS